LFVALVESIRSVFEPTVLSDQLLDKNGEEFAWSDPTRRTLSYIPKPPSALLIRTVLRCITYHDNDHPSQQGLALVLVGFYIILINDIGSARRLRENLFLANVLVFAS
jgi:hypothetical protein